MLRLENKQFSFGFMERVRVAMLERPYWLNTKRRSADSFYIKLGRMWIDAILVHVGSGHPDFRGLAQRIEPIQVPGEAIQMAGFGRICRGFSTAIGVHAKIRGVA